MLRGLVEDFKSLNLYIDVLLDYRISNLSNLLDPDEFDIVYKQDECLRKFEAHVKSCDFCFIVAPEFSNILFDFTEIVKRNNKVILSCNLDAIHIGSSKIRSYNFFLNNDLPTPKTYLIPKKKNHLSKDFVSQKFKELNEKIVIKPDDGVGAESIYYFDNLEQFEIFLQDELFVLDYNRNYILQEFVDGEDLSVSLLILPTTHKTTNLSNYKLIILSINSQYINIKQLEAKSEYTGGHTPIAGYNHIKKRLRAVLKNVDFSDFRGYIGIDFVKTKNNKFSFIEINPRLTTSYIGLRNAIETNIMGLLLHPEGTDDFIKIKKLNSTSIFSRLELRNDGLKPIKEIDLNIISKLITEVSEIITPPIRFDSIQKSDPVHYSCFVATKTEDLKSSKKRINQILRKFEKCGLKLIK